MMLFMQDRECFGTIKAKWKGVEIPGELKPHLGPLFTGALVVSNQAKVDELTFTHRKLKGIDMEAYAVFCAAKYADSPQPIAIAIKSISDCADEEKNDLWRRYAAYTSAAVLIEWIGRYA
jgi:nucleoside phosphorylase